jgi:heme-degrading monooxygenase HmoA
VDRPEPEHRDTPEIVLQKHLAASAGAVRLGLSDFAVESCIFTRTHASRDDARTGGSMAKFIYQVMIQCAPEVEDEFNKWYNEVHMPLVMQGGMLKAASRYKITDAVETTASTYTTLCEFDDRETFEKWFASDILAAARKNTAEVMGGKDVVWTGRAFYEPIAEFGK